MEKKAINSNLNSKLGASTSTLLINYHIARIKEDLKVDMKANIDVLYTTLYNDLYNRISSDIKKEYENKKIVEKDVSQDVIGWERIGSPDLKNEK